jgi:hypothetical protein
MAFLCRSSKGRTLELLARELGLEVVKVEKVGRERIRARLVKRVVIRLEVRVRECVLDRDAPLRREARSERVGLSAGGLLGRSTSSQNARQALPHEVDCERVGL